MSKYDLARWLSWLERRPVTAEVVGSNPIRVASCEMYRDTFCRGMDLSRKIVRVVHIFGYDFLNAGMVE